MNTTLNFLHYVVLYFVNVWVILAMFTNSRPATLHFAGALWPQAEVFLLQPVHLMLLPQVLFSREKHVNLPTCRNSNEAFMFLNLLSDRNKNTARSAAAIVFCNT